MNIKRSALSLSGLSQVLIAVGGRSERSALKQAEQYDIRANSWKQLPAMNLPRRYPGSCILVSGKAFCFCGVRHFYQVEYLNSIQTLHLQQDSKWCILPVNKKVAQNYHLAAVEYQNNIVLFGGQISYGGNMHIFSTQGQLLQDLSDDPIIPGSMCAGSTIVLNGKIYAAGLKYFNQKKMKWRPQVFNGKQWAFL